MFDEEGYRRSLGLKGLGDLIKDMVNLQVRIETLRTPENPMFDEVLKLDVLRSFLNTVKIESHNAFHKKASPTIQSLKDFLK